jgi:hypothetical protein
MHNSALRALLAVTLFTLIPTPAQAQHQWSYTLYSGVTRGGAGTPFSSPICSGVLNGDVIFSDVVSKGWPAWTTLCPTVNTEGAFGARFETLLPNSAGQPAFTVTVAGGGILYMDGFTLVDLGGEHDELILRSVARSLPAPRDILMRMDYYSWSGPSTLSVRFNSGITSVAPPTTPVAVVPEPTTMVLVGSGLLLLGSMARRKKGEKSGAS